MDGLMHATRVDALEVLVFRDRVSMGAAAAAEAAAVLRETIASRASCRAVFAAAPSQNEVLAGLAAAGGIDWGRVSAFHMDEYIGLPPDAPQRFGTLLRKALFGLVGLGATNYLSPGEAGPAQEATRYAALLAEAPIDLVCMGVGENGHIAFNDPPADLEDPLLVRKVELDEACRRQQVNDGCFATLEAVPRQALTMTVSALMSGRHLVCVVPGRSKAVAVRAMLECPVSGVCPASALRRHPNCSLYLDADSASLWLR